MATSPASNFNVKSASEALRAARQNFDALDGFPGPLPQSSKQAYAVQNMSREHWDDVVMGWKVGGIGPDHQKQFGAKRLAGPIFQKSVMYCSDGQTVAMPAYPGGFAAIEGEYVVKLKDVSNFPDRDVTLDDMEALVDSVYIGMELASSPMLLVNAMGPGSIISDFGNNGGLLIGPQVSNPVHRDYTKHTVTVTIDGEVIGSKPAGAGEAGPYGAVIFLLNHLRREGIDLSPGTLVSTGAISGVHETTIGSHSVVEFEGLGTMIIDLVPHTKA